MVLIRHQKIDYDAKSPWALVTTYTGHVDRDGNHLHWHVDRDGNHLHWHVDRDGNHLHWHVDRDGNHLHWACGQGWEPLTLDMWTGMGTTDTSMWTGMGTTYTGNVDRENTVETCFFKVADVANCVCRRSLSTNFPVVSPHVLLLNLF